MFVAKRILIITNEMKFALNVKKALERNGEFTVAVFSSGKAGVDHARSNPQDVAVVDFRMKDMPGTDMVDHLRTLQHDIAIIAAPNHPAIHDLKERYNIQRIINIPISIRKFVGILQSAKQELIDDQSVEPSTATPMDGLSIDRSAQTLEFWLSDDADGDTVLDMKPVEEEGVTPEASATFQRLAAEEPPMPPMSEGSTIRDLRKRLTSLDDIKRVLATAAQDSDQETQKILAGVESEDEEDTIGTEAIPAAKILEAAEDESTPINTFSLQEFIKRATRTDAGNIQPLPSWKESGQPLTTPELTPDELPFPVLDEAIEYTGTVTITTVPTIEDDPTQLDTDPIEPRHRSHPLEEAIAFETSSAEPLDDDEAEQHTAEMGQPTPPPPPELPDLVVSQTQANTLPYIDFDDDDSELAQLATTLTQVALELTADATVLARDGEIVGYAGRLPMAELEGLLEQLTIEWDKASTTNKSRILFAEIPETGAEFMVSTRGTQVGFTLSLIFSGTRPLHDIRRQSKRLLDSLNSLPQPQAPVTSVEPEDAILTEPVEDTQVPAIEEADIERTPIAYLWLQRDPNAEFSGAIQQKIRSFLDAELATSGWKVGEIQAADYVYVYGEMPQALNPRETLDLLREKSATSIDAQPAQLWDDSYLILQPGRELDTEEIQRFITFARW